MNLHEFLSAAASAGYLINHRPRGRSPSGGRRVAAELDGRPVLFTRVKGSAYPILIGVCSDRRYFGLALSTPADQVMFRLADALAAPSPIGQGVGVAPCQEVVEPAVDLHGDPFPDALRQRRRRLCLGRGGVHRRS